jgi:hypothetical protein
MTKFSKEVLREFKLVPDRVDDRPTAFLQPPTAIPGAGATGGTLRPGRGVAGLVAAGLALLSGKGKSTIPPGTGGPRRGGGFGGRGGGEPTPPGTGGGSGKDSILWKIAAVFGTPIGFIASKVAGGAAAVYTIYELLKRIYNKAIDSLPLSEEHKKWLKANMAIVIGAIAIAAGSIEAARRLTPRIMKVLRNRRIASEIGEALDAGDETLARTILLDAIEDENINLTAIRRKLGDDDYERLYRDYL